MKGHPNKEIIRLAARTCTVSQFAASDIMFSCPLDFGFIDISAHDIVPHIGQACARDETDIATSNHRDVHGRKQPTSSSKWTSMEAHIR